MTIPMDARTLVDYAASLDCIHCGLCLQTCPTYLLTGRESSSPRGRIHLMRSVAEGRAEPDAAYAEEMDFCLVCRHCESVCPSGVRFGEMMEHARDRTAPPAGLLERLARWIGFRVVLPRRAMLTLAFASLRTIQRAKLTGLVAVFLGSRGSVLRSVPPVPGKDERRPLPPRTPARGEQVGAVAVLEGCVMPELYGRVNRATVECLAACGLESLAPEGHACCGALHAHNGDLRGARALARKTILSFEALGEHTIAVNSAGCGAHMKDYGRILADDEAWSERARRFSERVRDLTEVLAGARRPESDATEIVAAGPVAYDDPCHLCHGQGIRDEPRELLDEVEGVARVELEDSELCCGSAGIYSFLRPEDSRNVFAPKLAAFEKSGARVLVTANPGCQLQWEMGLRSAKNDGQVVHIAEWLARAWRSS